VDGDVVFCVNRKVLHFQSPVAASAAISTFITPRGKTSKEIVLVLEAILPAGAQMSPGAST
jgi:hypothetical protein